MNASEITFGIEIECYVPHGTLCVGGYHHGIQVPGLPQGWNAQHDGSLVTRRRGYSPVEIVSPVLKGIDGLNQVKVVVEYLRSINAIVNDRCGLHVHVGVGNDRELVNKVVALCANHEKALYAATGTKSRERGRYCLPISSAFRQVDMTRPETTRNAADRYRLVNLSNLLAGSKPTVEFRGFAGTLNFGKIVMHIRVAVALVERAARMTRKGQWASQPPVATSPIHRKGVGHTAAVRLSYTLGWIKGRAKQVFGELTADGLPTIRQSMRLLIRLAKQYDTRE